LDYIDIHTHAITADGKSILNLFPSVDLSGLSTGLFSMGLHPWYVGSKDDTDNLQILRTFAANKSCVAIGETGLDKLAKSDFDLQKIIFLKHIEIAEEAGKPLIIHCVKAFEELLRIRKEHCCKVPWIIHGFNSNRQIAEKLLSEGILISFGKALRNPLSNAKRILKMIPDDVFFLETDDCSMKIHEIYDLAADVRKVPLITLKKNIHKNFKQTFGMLDD